MQKKLRAFIGVMLIAIPLFATPVGIWLSHDRDQSPVIMVQANVAYAEPGCGIHIPGVAGEKGDNLSLTECLARPIFYGMWYLASLAGRFVDFFLDYSISSTTYSNATQFVSRGWALVRDICNIFFIFALLYIAIGTILNLPQVNTGKMLVKVILIALLINFSLFFTKVVIDASNILARAFVGSMQVNVEIDENSDDPNAQLGESSVTAFSSAIMSKFKAQNLISDAKGTPYSAMQQEVGGTIKGEATLQTLRLVIYICGIAVFVVLIYAFFIVGLLFLARVIGLWITMITAPLAFVSIILPFNIPKMGHQEWFKSLFEYAFMAPIFLFFMYLIIMFLDTGFIDSVFANSNESIGEMIIKIIIPFAIIVMLVLQAKEITEKMSGEIGGAVVKAGGAIAGLGAAVITGGAALGLRSAVGAVGSKMAESKMGGRMGRMMRGAGKKLESSDMDWRNTSAGKAISKSMGLNTMGMGGAFAGKGGGHKGAKERYAKSREDDAKERVDLETADDKSTLDGLKTNMEQFKAAFGDDIRAKEKAINDARQELQDNPNDPTAIANLAKAKKDFDTWKKTPRKGPNGKMTTLSALQTNINAQEDVVKRKEFTVRQTVSKEVEGEWFTGMSKGTKSDVADKIRGGRSSGGSSGGGTPPPPPHP